MLDPDRNPVSVNEILNKETSIGNLIPSSQIVPGIVIVIAAYTLTNGFFSFGMPAFFALSIWGIASWGLLTGSQPYKFVDKFRSPPGTEWCNGNPVYLSPLPHNRPSPLRKAVPDTKARCWLKPIVRFNQEGQKQTLMPFQNYIDLVCPFTVRKDNREVSGYLLNRGSQYQVVFGFRTPGYHNLLDSSEVANAILDLEEGLKEFPEGEKMTIHSGVVSDDRQRQQSLKAQADGCRLPLVSVLIRNRQKRIQELTRTGARQRWDKVIFCTWSYSRESGSRSHDLVSQGVRFLTRLGSRVINWFTGNEPLYQEEFYKQLLVKAVDEGFLNWESLLNVKMGLEISPCDRDEHVSWIWQEFNDSPSPTDYRFLLLEETETELTLQECGEAQRDLTTLLIAGQGRSACPEHRRSGNTVWLPGRNQLCAVLALDKPPKQWPSQREQLRWLWTLLSKPSVRDTKAVVEISRGSAFVVRDSLSKHAKGAVSAQRRALEKGQGLDAGADVKAQESYEAQRKLYKGSAPINVGIAFLVYRHDQRQLHLACRDLKGKLGTARATREPNIAWSLWLETLPVTTSWLLHTSSTLSNRRLTFETDTVQGVLPLTEVRDIDRRGVEFITEGGKAVCVDLHRDHTSRAVLTGESGSGKTALAWEFMLDVLADNVPIVGMDLSNGQGSSFRTAIGLLGEAGAYNDTSRHSSNLMEIPDLRRIARHERRERLDQWKEFTRKILTSIAMGRVNDPRLDQRVDALILRALDVFLSDPIMIERYNVALERGYQSRQWQDIPLLPDFLSFCTKEQLNLQHVQPVDEAALNQIRRQIEALLESPLGRFIGRPSTYSPDPIIKFFSLKELTNEQDQNLMALNIYAACMRNALAYPKSCFIGDEISTLLKWSGFADRIGSLYAIGRKSGISAMLIGQDLHSIRSCSAGAQILDNTVYRLTGCVTNNGAQYWVEREGYDRSIISRNASESFQPRRSALYSNWLIERNGRYWQGRYYPGAMTLATVVNDPAELQARERVLSHYPPTLHGQLSGLRQFSDEYVRAIRQGLPLENVGQPLASAPVLPKTPKTSSGRRPALTLS